jgi:hypothetical protein
VTADLSDLLTAHLAGAPMSQTLSALAAGRPDLSALTQALAQREQQRETQQADQAPLDDLLAFERETGSSTAVEGFSLEQLELLRRNLNDLNAEVARLQLAVETAARALGACPVCLGADPVCPLCRGRGAPGSLPPDPVAFRTVALPAVRAYAYARSRSPGAPAEQLAPDHTSEGARR